MHPFNYHTVIQQKLDTLKLSGGYRQFLETERLAETYPSFLYRNEKGVLSAAVNWCSNDYLSMGLHPEVIEAQCSVTADSGVGSGGTRNISGTTIHHVELEKTLAALHQKEAALLFNGAYLANVTVLSTLGKIFPELVFFSDEENHASIIEGIRGSGGKKEIFNHNDLSHLEALLSSYNSSVPKIIVFESVYSISGDVAPVEEIVALAKRFNALTYIDEVHAVGMYGQGGAGIASAAGVQNKIDIINGTLAKGFGVMGGYIAADVLMTDAIRSFGSGFIFTTSLAPGICAAAQKSIELLKDADELREMFSDTVIDIRRALEDRGIPFHKNQSHITRIVIGDENVCKSVAKDLLESYGIYIQPVFYPTVPKGMASLRITSGVRYTKEHIDQLANALESVLVGHGLLHTISIL